MLSNILIYLLLGVVYSAIMEFLNAFYLDYDEEWKWYDRVIMVLIWPILLIIFLVYLVKSFLGL